MKNSEKLTIEINPTNNNICYITSKFNLAISGKIDIEIYVLDWKLIINENYLKLDILHKSHETLGEWNKCLSNIEFDSIEETIRHVTNFCEKSYKNKKVV